MDRAPVDDVDVRERRLRRPIAADFAGALVGRRILQIDRRGKYLLLQLSGEQVLLVHLGMSGALLVQPAGALHQLHDHVHIHLSTGVQLTYNDPRRFGLLRVGRLAEFGELHNVGVDPLGDDLDLAQLRAMTRARKRPIKNVLMDQRLLGGIGNIYANEILFRARLRPTRQARRLTRRELTRLRAAVRVVLRSAVRAGGSSISDYRDADGRPGYFQLRLQVYDRAGQPCRRCDMPIRRIVQAGRSSFYCPSCQG